MLGIACLLAALVLALAGCAGGATASSLAEHGSSPSSTVFAQLPDGELEPGTYPILGLDGAPLGTDPTPTEVDGYAGESVTIHVPVDADLEACDDNEFGSWSSDVHGARGHATPGERDEIRVVDVDGVRLVIDASMFPDSSDADVAEPQSVIDSIQLAPVD